MAQRLRGQCSAEAWRGRCFPEGRGNSLVIVRAGQVHPETCRKSFSGQEALTSPSTFLVGQNLPTWGQSSVAWVSPTWTFGKPGCESEF